MSDSFISVVIEEYKKRRAAAIEAKEKAAIARAFNNRYTYRTAYPPFVEHSYRGAWMCPTCNHIHPVIGHSVFNGLHYPACCEYAAGHRHDMGIK